MISHLRLATQNSGGGRDHGGGKSSKKSPASKSDRTSSLQANLKNIHFSGGKPENNILCSDMPRHFGGRGHLEGSCVAKAEGLLESKSQKRKRKRNGGRGKKNKKSKTGINKDDSDDGYEGNSDSEEEEEEKKVWKPTQHDSEVEGGEKSGQEAANFSSELKSLTKEGLDWNKKSKYGKKSNINFQNWVETVATKMHAKRVEGDDEMFIHM